MAIEVELRDERGKTLRRINGVAIELSRSLPPAGDPDFPMLSYIDPYGNTVFNSLQMRTVVPELRRLQDLLPNSTGLLEEIIEVAEQCEIEAHTYLVFIGD